MKITPNEFTKEVRHEMRGGKGDVVMQHVVKDSLPNNMRLFSKIVMEPGCSIGHHEHKKETEFYVILKGEATVNDDGTLVPCTAGDVIVTPDGYGHSIENTGSETMEMLAVIVLD